MISLSYVSAYDPYHAIFRYFCLSTQSSMATITVGAYRILDYYFCFPHLLKSFSAARNIQGLIRAHNQVKRDYSAPPYQALPDERLLYSRMRLPQLTCLSTMARNQYISEEELGKEMVVRTEREMPAETAQAVLLYVKESASLLEVLGLMAKIPLLGRDGLKHRSGLEEYRYDYVHAQSQG